MTEQHQNINDDQPLVFVIGYPIKHSRSPLIHNHWISVHGLHGRYEKREVAPDDLASFAEQLHKDGVLGCNVTIPHKLDIMGLVDQVTDTARAIGAVNTIFKQNGQLIGDNTDAYGFIANLDDAQPNWEKQSGEILVIGAGGATRGLVYGLRSKTIDRPIRIFNRTLDRAEQIASDMRAQFPSEISAHSVDTLSENLDTAGLVINATSLGMKGENIEGLDVTKLPDTAIVTDIVYTPLETPLLKAAKNRGLATNDGLGMLLHQAVPGFEAWFGVRPTVDKTVRNIVLADLGEN